MAIGAARPRPAKRPELFRALAEARLEGRRHFEVAAAAARDPAELSRILCWHRDPTHEEAVALAKVLGCWARDLFPDFIELEATS
jgi:hypothetical protein